MVGQGFMDLCHRSRSRDCRMVMHPPRGQSNLVYMDIISQELQWIVAETGSATRLPPLGPHTPAGHPLLILVTQAHLLHIYNIPTRGKSQLVGRASLLQPTNTQHPAPEPDSVGKTGGDKICVKAAIGICYQGKHRHTLLDM